MELAALALEMIPDKPFFGVGINNWGIKINPPYEYSRHRDPRRGFTEDYKDGIVETIYLLVAAECGLPCLLALLALFGYYWCAAWRLLGKKGFVGPEAPAKVGDSFQEGEVGFHLRDGIHFLGRGDWLNYMAFMRKHW